MLQIHIRTENSDLALRAAKSILPVQTLTQFRRVPSLPGQFVYWPVMLYWA